jgi:hypothetical protein
VYVVLVRTVAWAHNPLLDRLAFWPPIPRTDSYTNTVAYVFFHGTSVTHTHTHTHTVTHTQYTPVTIAGS